MQNPLVIERRSAIDPAAARGMSYTDWKAAVARMENAMALGDFALRVARRLHNRLHTAVTATRGGGAPNRA